MSKNRQVVVQTDDGRTLTLPAGTPDEAPLPHYDVMADNLTLDDILPDRYFNRENVRRMAESAGGELVLTFARAQPE
ncbi:MAG: hypothetical protein KDE34_28725, partial [Anaerolineales bacterium]|nr:hypothetical protein [Anaerolineales bacterium]